MPRQRWRALERRPSKLNRRLAERLHEGGSETRPYTIGSFTCRGRSQIGPGATRSDRALCLQPYSFASPADLIRGSIFQRSVSPDRRAQRRGGMDARVEPAQDALVGWGSLCPCRAGRLRDSCWVTAGNGRFGGWLGQRRESTKLLIIQTIHLNQAIPNLSRRGQIRH